MTVPLTAAPDAAMTIRDRTSHPIILRAALAVLTILALTVQGPGGTWTLPLLTRIIEVAGGTLAWEASVAVLARTVRRHLGRTTYERSPWPLVSVVLLASLPATACMAAVCHAVGDQVTSPTSFYARSLVLGLVITFARQGLRRGWMPTGADRPQPERQAPITLPPSDVAAAFVRRHAPQLAGRRLLALEAEDHYLRLHTEGGSALILMRLRDAVAALGPGSGWQPHRSFWLSADAGAKARRVGQAWQLTLLTGLAVPVGRSKLAAMRTAGHHPGRTMGSASVP